jgi:hypothetical protein
LPRGQGRARSTLFLSCDLVGSTHFKQTQSGWQKIFLSFYREFPQFLAAADRDVDTADATTTEFLLWKAVGDELIFQVDVRDEKQISRAVRVWLKAIGRYEQQSLRDQSLALKGGAFIATFPGPDSESTIPRNPNVETSDEPVVILNDRALSGNRSHVKYLYDYFGPSIDTGFRLLGLSSRRYFTLSIEVAWAIALAAHGAQAHQVDHEVHFTDDFVHYGSHVLKGVWNAREYPVFAIDRDHDDKVNLALSKLNGTVIDSSLIIEVCRACGEDPSWPFSLYLPDAANAGFQVTPDDAMSGLLESESNLDGAESVPNPDGTDSLSDLAPLD